MNRYLKDTKPLREDLINGKILGECKAELIFELKKHFSGRISLVDFLQGKQGKLRTRYLRAMKDCLDKNFDLSKIRGITAFIKKEIFDEKKAPRSIMGRDPRFNLIYGLYTTPLEHAMVKLPQVMKGKNFVDRGSYFRDFILSKNMVEGDMSKYEGSQRQYVLKWELEIWKALLPPDDYFVVEKLWRAKYIKEGHYLQGTKFSFVACRGSGDMDTGLFNTLLNWIMCRYFERINKLGSGNFAVDGDDNMVNCFDKTTVIDTFSHFGFDCKLFMRHDYHDVDFCSSRFIQFRPGHFIQVQKLSKLLSNVFVVKNNEFNKCLGEYMYSLGFMYSKLYGDMPIYSDLANFLMISGAQNKGKHFNMELMSRLDPTKSAVMLDDVLKCDRDFCLAEIGYTFQLGFATIESIVEQLNVNLIHLPTDCDYRFRRKGKCFEWLLDHAEIVESKLFTAARQYKYNKKIFK